MNTTLHLDQECIDVCNRLLRVELSALATYRQVLARFAGEPALPELKRISREHAASVGRLHRLIHDMGGRPATDASAWGAFTTALPDTTNLLGEGSAVSMIQRGERHGENEYEDALAHPGVTPGYKEIIRRELLPRVKRHLAVLRTLGRN